MSAESEEAQENKRGGLNAKIAEAKAEMERVSLGGKKALVITDTIETGESVGGFVSALRANGIAFDVVAVGLNDDFVEIPDGSSEYVSEKLEGQWGTKIIWGEEGAPPIYKSTLSGVTKKVGDLHAARSMAQSTRVAEGRKMAEDMAHRIAQKFLNGELQGR